jgi:hypothetical protein
MLNQIYVLSLIIFAIVLLVSGGFYYFYTKINSFEFEKKEEELLNEEQDENFIDLENFMNNHNFDETSEFEHESVSSEQVEQSENEINSILHENIKKDCDESFLTEISENEKPEKKVRKRKTKE